MFREFFSKGIGIAGFIITFNGLVCSLIGLMLIKQGGSTLFSIGIPMLAIGGIFVVLRIDAIEKRQILLNSGISTSGTITQLKPSRMIRINGRYPWIVYYQYQIKGNSFTGKETIVDLPKNYIIGNTIKVFYNPTNPKLSTI